MTFDQRTPLKSKVLNFSSNVEVKKLFGKSQTILQTKSLTIQTYTDGSADIKFTEPNTDPTKNTLTEQDIESIKKHQLLQNVNLLYCEPWIQKSTMDHLIYRQDAGRKALFVFGDHGDELKALDSATRQHTGRQAAMLKNMDRNTYQNGAIGIVSTISGKRKDELSAAFEQSIEKLSERVTRDNPLLIVPAKFKDGQLVQISIGNGIGEKKEAMQQYGFENFQKDLRNNLSIINDQAQALVRHKTEYLDMLKLKDLLDRSVNQMPTMQAFASLDLSPKTLDRVNRRDRIKNLEDLKTFVEMEVQTLERSLDQNVIQDIKTRHNMTKPSIVPTVAPQAPTPQPIPTVASQAPTPQPLSHEAAMWDMMKIDKQPQPTQIQTPEMEKANQERYKAYVLIIQNRIGELDNHVSTNTIDNIKTAFFTNNLSSPEATVLASNGMQDMAKKISPSTLRKLNTDINIEPETNVHLSKVQDKAIQPNTTQRWSDKFEKSSTEKTHAEKALDNNQKGGHNRT